MVSLSGSSFGEDRVSRVSMEYLLDQRAGTYDRRFTAANEDLGFTKKVDRTFLIGGPSRVP